jgi:hypothetical protein
VKQYLLFFLAAAVAAFLIPALHAQISYSDFSSTAGLQLNGDAQSVNGGLRLTSSTSFAAGSVFSTDRASLASNASFSTFFTFRMSNTAGLSDEDGQGADGIVFVIQTVSNTVGTSGGGIGYSGLTKSLGVELDTWNNGGGLGDPNGNHVSFDFNGTFSPASQAVSVPSRMNNSDLWSAWIDYNGSTQGLELRLADNSVIRPAAALLVQVVDLPSILGTTDAFVGFTAATGNAYENHDILSWTFRNEFRPIDDLPPTSAVPEPSTYAIIATVGLFGLVLNRNRQRFSKAKAQPYSS